MGGGVVRTHLHEPEVAERTLQLDEDMTSTDKNTESLQGE
jgi:hypothetical protein